MLLGSLRLIGIACLAICLVSKPVLAQDWANWRGPSHNGATEAKDLPTEFSKKKQVRWAADMPGPGASTPIVVGDKIFLTSVDSERGKLVALCVNRKDGKTLWMRDAGSGYRPGDRGSETALGRRSNYASPSATTDGERVVFFFGNGDLVAYDFAGKELWRRNIQKDYGDFAFQWTFSATPTIWEGKVYLPILQRDVPTGRRRRRRGPSEDEPQRDPIQSFLLALDPSSGKTIFKHVRPSDARKESLESYATITPYVGKDGRKELLVVGGDVITGHDPETGKELWRWGTWNAGHRQEWWRLVPSVVTGSGVALVCAPKRAPVYAIKLGGEGTLGPDALAWQSKGRPNPVSSDVPTPAYHDGHMYVLSDVRNALSKVDAKTGEVRWTTEVSADYRWRASPTVADGKVWLISHGGEVVVIDASSGKSIRSIFMSEEDEDSIRSSVVVAHGCVFIRTNKKLFCLAK